MTTVFLSGSRSISRLSSEITHRLDNIVESNLNVVVGDANGADKAMQKYLAARKYENVVVYHVGVKARNNIGYWPTKGVDTESNFSGWEYYAHKDKEMATFSDFGLVVWDGESAGSIHNVFELLSNNKKTVVFYNPKKMFFNISDSDNALKLLELSSPQIRKTISSKIRLTKYLNLNEKISQKTFGF